MCILFVEDDPLITMLSEDALQDAGHQVMKAAHASAAVDLIARNPGHFVCLVTDIQMPGELTGLDLVEHAREIYPAMPIVVVTGRPDRASTEWRKRHGVTLLAKPYGQNAMVDTVEHLLSVARAMPQQPRRDRL